MPSTETSWITILLAATICTSCGGQPPGNADQAAPREPTGSLSTGPNPSFPGLTLLTYPIRNDRQELNSIIVPSVDSPFTLLRMHPDNVAECVFPTEISTDGGIDGSLYAIVNTAQLTHLTVVCQGNRIHPALVAGEIENSRESTLLNSDWDFGVQRLTAQYDPGEYADFFLILTKPDEKPAIVSAVAGSALIEFFLDLPLPDDIGFLLVGRSADDAFFASHAELAVAVPTQAPMD